MPSDATRVLAGLACLSLLVMILVGLALSAALPSQPEYRSVCQAEPRSTCRWVGTLAGATPIMSATR